MENDNIGIGTLAGIVLAVIIVLAVAAFGGYAYRRRRGKSSAAATGEGGTAPAPTEEWQRILKRFADNFGGIWSIAHGRKIKAAAIFTNLDLVVRYAGSPSVAQWWASFTTSREDWTEDTYRRKAADLLALLARCGLETGPVGRVWVDQDTRSFYTAMGEELAPGQAARVLLPYWKYRGVIIEKGLIAKE